MRTIRLLTTLLLAAIWIGISACSEDLETDSNGISTPNFNDEVDKLFAEYMEDYYNIKCRFGQQNENSVLLSGMKDNHLWFREYDATTKQLESEWTDIEKTDTILNIHIGYGEYKTAKLWCITPRFYKKTDIGNIVTLAFHTTYTTLELSGSYYQTIFTFNEQSKRTKLQPDELKNIANNWYAESVFIGNCCYSHKGEIIYESEVVPRYHNTLPISYEEGIILDNRNISKFNYKESKSVWNTYIESPFHITSGTKINYTLLDNSTNVWQYKCEAVFYDGSKEDFTFKINIDNGKIINNATDISVTGISLNETSKELDIIDTFQLIATIEPANATNTNIIWSSSNEEVATVNQEGLVTAKSIGETTITATTEDGNFKATATIKVLSPKYITQIKSDNGNYSYNMSLTYANGKLSNYIWKYNNGNYEFNQKIDYSGKKVIMSGIVDGEDCVQTYTLNGEGYATSCSIPDYEGKAIEISFEYSEEGYLIKAIEIIKLPNETRSNTYSFTYSKDGDIIQGNESDISGVGSLYTQTFSSRINKSGIMDYVMSQLLFNYQTAFYCGLLGKPCKHLPSSCKETEIPENGWSKTYEFIHEQDSNSYVTKTVISDSDRNSEVLTYTYDK